MKSISLPIVIERKSPLRKIILYVLICLWAAVFTLQFDENKNSFKEELLIITGGITIGFAAVDDLIAIVSRRKIPIFDSSLELTDKVIRIQIVESILEYSLDELNSVTLSINETSFDPNPRGFINKRRSGKENWMEVRAVDGTYYKYKLYIDSADEIGKLDLFLAQLGEKKYVLKRGMKKVASIKKAHYDDIPLHYRETRRSRY